MSGFGPAIEATVGASVEPLRRAGPEIENTAGTIASGISKKFEMKDVGRTLAVALGLSLESVASKAAAVFFGISETVKKAWGDLVESTARAGEIMQGQFAARRGDSQAAAAAQEQLNSLGRQRLGLLQQEEALNTKMAKLEANAAAGTLIGKRLIQEVENQRLAVQQKLAANQAEQQKAGGALDAARLKITQEQLRLEQTRFEQSLKGKTTHEQILALATREYQLEQQIEAFKGAGVELDAKKLALQQTTAALEAAQQKLREEGDKRALDLDEETWKYMQDNRELLELEAKLKTGTLLPVERARLDILRLQTKEKDLQWEKDALLAKGAANWTEADRQRYQSLVNQGKQLEQQVALKQQVIDATKEQVKVEEAVAEEIHYGTAALKSFVEKWTGWQQSIATVGRGDKELSDRELERKIRNIRSDIFQRELATQNGGYDFFLSPQRSNLSQALAEQRFRNNVRNSASFFGEDRAFEMFPGLTEQRFQEILSTRSADDRLVDRIEKLSDRQEAGLGRIAEALNARKP